MTRILMSLAACGLLAAPAFAQCEGDDRCPEETVSTDCTRAFDATAAWTVESPSEDLLGLVDAVGAACGAEAERAAAREAVRGILRHVMPRWSTEIEQPELDALVFVAARLNAGYWQVHALRGDRAEVNEDWPLAAEELQLAATLAADERDTSERNAPSNEVIADFANRARYAMSLSDDFVPILRGRDDAPAGVFVLPDRGGVPVRTVPTPIEFATCAEAYDAENPCGVQFSERGAAYVVEFWEFVRTRGARFGSENGGATAACILGHTDERGPADLNRMLSERRSQAVQARLLELAQANIASAATLPENDTGARARVEADAALARVQALRAEGCGEDAPLPLEGTLHGNLSLEEQHQIQRRVELDLEGSCGCAASD